MTHGSLFSGIGGFDLAAQWMGWENKFHCEWNEFGQRVLHHYWPDAELFTDITKSDFTKYANQIDVLTGGFPCQPYSKAGKRRGKEDQRHLWPEMLRVIREIKPRYVVGENVRGLITWNAGLVFDEVCSDLENLRYQVAPFIIPASSVNAPHQRERIWFVAYSDCASTKHEIQTGWNMFASQSNNGNVTNSDSNGCNNFDSKYEKHASEARIHAFNDVNATNEQWQNFPTQPPLCSGDDGLPTKLDGITFPKWRNESIKAYGNAVVPQVVYQIFKAIEAYESKR
jgi:DNA (cytosine-5)-methyltransferase 1